MIELIWLSKAVKLESRDAWKLGSFKNRSLENEMMGDWEGELKRRTEGRKAVRLECLDAGRRWLVIS